MRIILTKGERSWAEWCLGLPAFEDDGLEIFGRVIPEFSEVLLDEFELVIPGPLGARLAILGELIENRQGQGLDMVVDEGVSPRPINSLIRKLEGAI